MGAIDKYLPTVLERAQVEAREDGSTTIEAKHLLLAIAHESEPTTRQVLQSVRLDRDAIRRALDREFERSLNSVGVSSAAYNLPKPTALPANLLLGTSSKLALERGFASVRRKKDARPGHVLLGILSARFGTVPRALALAGIDPAELRASLLWALTT